MVRSTGVVGESSAPAWDSARTQRAKLPTEDQGSDALMRDVNYQDECDGAELVTFGATIERKQTRKPYGSPERADIETAARLMKIKPVESWPTMVVESGWHDHRIAYRAILSVTTGFVADVPCTPATLAIAALLAGTASWRAGPAPIGGTHLRFERLKGAPGCIGEPADYGMSLNLCKVIAQMSPLEAAHIAMAALKAGMGLNACVVSGTEAHGSVNERSTSDYGVRINLSPAAADKARSVEILPEGVRVLEKDFGTSNERALLVVGNDAE